MIIQRVIKGVAGGADGIDEPQALQILQIGLRCRWWQRVDPLPWHEVPQRLTDRNLIWHQNCYDCPDLDDPNGENFYLHTPFISTTAGTVERSTFWQTNILQPAWVEALRFATAGWQRDGYLFYCYVFLIGKQAVRLESYAEELRELNIYTGYSPFHPEGEITAKIMIPPAQIERVEFWSHRALRRQLAQGQMPRPRRTWLNHLCAPPKEYDNVRDVLG